MLKSDSTSIIYIMGKAKDLLIAGLALKGVAEIAENSIDEATAIFINNIKYSIGKPNASITRLEFGLVDIQLPVTVTNRNPITISVDKFLGEVSYGLVPLSIIEIPTNFSLEQDAATIINLNFEVNIQSTVEGVFNAAQNGGFSALLEDFHLVGEIFILGSIRQIAIPVDLKIPLF